MGQSSNLKVVSNREATMAAVAEVAEVETCTDIVTLHTAKGPHIYPSQITLK